MGGGCRVNFGVTGLGTDLLAGLGLPALLVPAGRRNDSGGQRAMLGTGRAWRIRVRYAEGQRHTNRDSGGHQQCRAPYQHKHHAKTISRFAANHTASQPIHSIAQG